MSSATNIRTLVPQPTGDTQFNVRDAALIGAASAFAKPKPKPKPQANLYTGVSGGDHGALLAASKVGTGQHKAPIQPLSAPISRDHTGRSSTARSLSNKPSTSTLGVPEDKVADRVSSPSNIAARLAAARNSPMPTPKDRLDDTPVPPTASLVRMFEQKRVAPPPSPPPSTEPLTVVKRSPPPIRSPKPQRAIPLPQEPTQDGPPPAKPKPKVKPTPKPKPRTLSMDGFSEDTHSNLRQQPFFDRPLPKQKPPQLAKVGTEAIQPKPPSLKGPRQTRPKSEDLTRVNSIKRQFSSAKSIDSDDASFVSASEEPHQGEEEPPKRPEPPPPRRSAKPQPDPVPVEEPPTAKPKPKPIPLPAQPPPKSSSVPPRPLSSKKSPSPPNRSDRLSLPTVTPVGSRMPSPGSDAVFSSNYQRQSAKQLTQHLTGESISNAIVGAALASARAPSRDQSRGPSPRQTSSPPPPPPTRRHHHHLHVSSFHNDRSPSPHKPAPPKLRTTLRKDPSTSSDEDETEKYKKKGTRVMGMRKKHPNKHHEGTRKRWRDSITERERKRYEGVWAANKGLFITDQSRRTSGRVGDASPSPDDPAQDVLNLVVREIWSRSRLPEFALEEIWDLVDSRGVGRLRRDEFVVGLWLVDQRLKGRKMPPRVSDSVWDSVRGAGVRVKVRK